jgi:hypothetical protein
LATSNAAAFDSLGRSLSALSHTQSTQSVSVSSSLTQISTSLSQTNRSLANVSTSLVEASGAITELNNGLANLAGDVDRLRGESRRGIAAVAAIGAVGTAGQAPGELGIDIGVAGYRGQGAVATNVSYVTESGVVLSAGASYAGNGATVVRLGIGLRLKLGNKGKQRSTDAPAIAATTPTAQSAPASTAESQKSASK